MTYLYVSTSFEQKRVFIIISNSCVVEESRDKQAERICNKNTHLCALKLVGTNDDNAHFENWTMTRCPQTEYERREAIDLNVHLVY